MNIWLRLSATFHEHPKMLAVRKAAGSRCDSAELGWYRLLMAAKRYGRWTFASEAHLEHVAGPFYRFVPLYREHGLLDDLTVHDGDSYNAIKTDAERKAEQRERDRVSQPSVTGERDVARDQSVTLHTERERETEDREQNARANDPYQDDEAEVRQWLANHGCYIRPGNGYDQKLVTAVAHHGAEALLSMMVSLKGAGTKDGDVKGFLFGAIDALDARSRPKLSVLESEDREEERRSAQARRLAATQKLIHDNGGHVDSPSAGCPNCAKEGVKP